MKSRATHQGTGLSRGTGDASTLVGENSIQDWQSGLSYRDLRVRSSPVLLGHRQGGIFSSSRTVLPTSFIDIDEMKRREKDK